jgi:hypothetical protein
MLFPFKHRHFIAEQGGTVVDGFSEALCGCAACQGQCWVCYWRASAGQRGRTRWLLMEDSSVQCCPSSTEHKFLPRILVGLPWRQRQHTMCPITSVYVYSNQWTGLDSPWGFQYVEAPRFHDNRHVKVVTFSALRTGHLYSLGNIPGTPFCRRLSRPQVHSAAGRIMPMKNSNGTIGNRTRDLPACSAVP